MKEKIKTFCSLCILIFAAPYVVTLLFQGGETSPAQKSVERIKEEDKEEKIDIEEYVKGIVAKQISPESEAEMLKAQTVIARTMLVKAREEGGSLPQAMEAEEMLKLWGENGTEEKYRALEKAAAATRGEILVWEGRPAEAAYHAVSAGKTRKGQEVLGREDVPYLETAESGKDIVSPDYLKVIFMEKQNIAEKLKEKGAGETLKPEEVPAAIQIVERDSAGYVLKMQISGKEVSGEEFRQYLDLASSCFYMKEVEGQVRILTKGLGHGLGLSQYGGNEMAKEGKSYREILNYYYKGLQLKTY